MNATLTETKSQEKNRLLTELYKSEIGHARARRNENWLAAQSYAEDMARVEKLLSLNEKSEEL